MSNYNRIFFAASLIFFMLPASYAAKMIPAAEPATINIAAPTAAANQTTATPVIPQRATIVTAQAAESPAKTSTPVPTATTRSPSAIGTGFYIGAQLGDSSVGAVMGYQFTRMFGMEISYDYFDPLYTRAVTTTTAEKNRLGASGLAMFPIKFSDMGPMALYVKVGYARTTDKLTTDDPGLPPSIPASTFITTVTKTGVTGGAGIHVDMSASASVRLGVNVVGIERTTYLAALYRF